MVPGAIASERSEDGQTNADSMDSRGVRRAVPAPGPRRLPAGRSRDRSRPGPGRGPPAAATPPGRVTRPAAQPERRVDRRPLAVAERQVRVAGRSLGERAARRLLHPRPPQADGAGVGVGAGPLAPALGAGPIHAWRRPRQARDLAPRGVLADTVPLRDR